LALVDMGASYSLDSSCEWEGTKLVPVVVRVQRVTSADTSPFSGRTTKRGCLGVTSDGRLWVLPRGSSLDPADLKSTLNKTKAFVRINLENYKRVGSSGSVIKLGPRAVARWPEFASARQPVRLEYNWQSNGDRSATLPSEMRHFWTLVIGFEDDIQDEHVAHLIRAIERLLPPGKGFTNKDMATTATQASTAATEPPREEVQVYGDEAAVRDEREDQEEEEEDVEVADDGTPLVSLQNMLRTPDSKQSLFEMFTKYDADHNGHLDAAEMLALTKDFIELLDVQADDRPPTLGFAQQIIDALDTDRDGTVSFDELCDNADKLAQMYQELQTLE
jgi:EF-hand domain pair